MIDDSFPGPTGCCWRGGGNGQELMSGQSLPGSSGTPLSNIRSGSHSVQCLQATAVCPEDHGLSGSGKRSLREWRWHAKCPHFVTRLPPLQGSSIPAEQQAGTGAALGRIAGHQSLAGAVPHSKARLLLLAGTACSLPARLLAEAKKPCLCRLLSTGSGTDSVSWKQAQHM